MKKILLLGCTGSIGTQTLDVVKNNKNNLKVVGIVAGSNIALLKKQIKEFSPKAVGMRDQIAGLESLGINSKKNLFIGEEAILELISTLDYDLAVVAISGAAGLKPAITAIRAGRNVALATKEVMVLAGEIVMSELKKKNLELKKRGKPAIDIFPIDSEHSAIWQSLRAGHHNEIEKIILTCSGGPFLHKRQKDLAQITPAQALRHPKWNMGQKITIDSATLMNKGLEIIEAKWLFDISEDRIEVVIHPESILHSAVQFCDSSIIGQFGLPDMRTPIQYALTYPERIKNSLPRLALDKIGSLTFELPDTKTFPALSLARYSIAAGGTTPTVLNAADEVAVGLFLENKIKFLDIIRIVEQTIKAHRVIKNPSLKDILNTDRWAREYSNKLN